MKNILIYGSNSFIAKNFVIKYENYYNIYCYNKYFKNQKKFSSSLFKYIKRNKIKYLINFAADNNNSKKNESSKKILNSNFILPVTLLDLSEKLNVTIFLFLSAEATKNNEIKNFYALSKKMLFEYVYSRKFSNKIRIINFDSVFGSFDKNFQRLIPSMMINFIKSKKVNINLNQKKKLIHVDEVNKKISNLLYSKKKLIYSKIDGKLYNIYIVYKFIKKYLKNKKLKKNKYKNFISTYKWYLKYYGQAK